LFLEESPVSDESAPTSEVVVDANSDVKVDAKLLEEKGTVGPLVASFTFSRKRRLVFGILGTALLLLVFAGIFAADANPEEYRKMPMTTKGQAWVFGSLATTAGAYLLFNAIRHRRVVAAVGANGLISVENNHVQTLRWDEIRTVREIKARQGPGGNLFPVMYALGRSEAHMFVVEGPNGQEIRFRSYLNPLAKLGALIQERTLPHLLPPALAAMEARDTLDFGPVWINRHKMGGTNFDAVPLAEVTEVKAVISWDNGVLSVSHSGPKPASFFIDEVPNWHVLQAVFRHYHSQPTDRAT
jgi:hypothetical protein